MTNPFGDAEARRRPLMYAAFVAAGLFALLALVAPYNGATWRVPRVLEQKIAAALVATGNAGLEIEMQGQRAVLRGVAAHEDDIEAARRAALTAAGPGGPWAGGVTGVDASGVSVGRFDTPFEWSVRREGARVILSGAAPSENVREDLLVAAQRRFPNTQAVDRMHVAGGAPSPAFAEMAAAALRYLPDMATGEARIVDSQIVIIGDGNQRAVDALRRGFANPPAPFRVRLAVTVDGVDVDNPELQGLNLASGNAETCARAFQRLMERNVINFAQGSAEIDPSSRRILDALASVALRCDRYSIEVAGHTDNQGARELNMELSRQRADAVAAYLSSQGVARSRLTARGYGPDAPRAPNTTPAGQAANRRIEFNVTG